MESDTELIDEPNLGSNPENDGKIKSELSGQPRSMGLISATGLALQKSELAKSEAFN